MAEVDDSARAYLLAYPFIQLGLRLLARSLAPRFRITGLRHVPRRGAAIIAPNHLSYADPPLVSAAIHRPLWFMAKRELFDIPVVAPVIRFWRTFPVDQKGADRAALRRAEQLLQRGHAVVIFPEGQCSPSGELGPILPGVGLLTLRTKVPIIPVGISGSECIAPYGSMLPRPTWNRVHMHFGAPLNLADLEGLPSRAQRDAVAQRLESALRQVTTIARG